MEDKVWSLDYKLVPWLSWDQWIFVRESLFSSSPDSISAALKRISSWRSRGCLPIIIEVTASIVEIQQRDPFFRKGPSNVALNSEEMLAMLYCMAITRLVNGVIEKTRKKTEVSIAEAADAIGIPRILIDIRHEGSHRNLPSLQLVRLASVKALDWLKSHYWEPQKNAILSLQNGISDVRKEIKSELRKLAFCLSAKQASCSLPMRGRRIKQSELLFGHKKMFTHMVGKLQACKSEGSKKQITMTLRLLVQLYSSYPSEVVAVLLEILLKTDSSDGREEDHSDNSKVEPGQVSINTLTGAIDIWKLVISRFSSKEPELLLTMLREVLKTIGNREAMRSEIVGSGPGIQDSLAVANVQNQTLTELLRTCLLVLSPGNNQLAGAALLLAQMIGNISMVERLKIFSQLSLPSLDCAEETTSGISVQYFLHQHEESISQAAEKLEFLKRCRIKGKTVNTLVRNSDKEKKVNTWTMAKAWNPCPIGMVPSALNSAGILPILDRTVDMPEVQQVSESSVQWELNRCGKREASCDVESLEDSEHI